jgi:hypothetical protein
MRPAYPATAGKAERVAPLGVNAATSNPVVATSGSHAGVGASLGIHIGAGMPEWCGVIAVSV